LKDERQERLSLAFFSWGMESLDRKSGPPPWQPKMRVS
jgi:hypothetical protein